MILQMKKYNVQPIICLDGRNLEAKDRTRKFRDDKKTKEKEQAEEYVKKGDVENAKKHFSRCLIITKEMVYKLVEMCRALNVSCMIAPYEADAQVAYLCRKGYADIAMSEDSDLLCYNTPTTIFKLGSFGECEYISLEELREKRKKREKLKNDALNTLFSLNEQDFTSICVMCGCDYLPSVKGMGPKTALKYFDRLGSIDRVIGRMRIDSGFSGKVPEDYEKHVKRVSQIFLYQLVFDPEEKNLTTFTPVDDLEKFVNENGVFVGKLFPNCESHALGDIDFFN
mmetsp:Transcript_13781/g.11734  ORF Transcript_13781/g.11734 Transcript_13781/m.11734 type:complete len:283 (-) Transcript_13781:467-1315(-)